ncbi:MAG TPA: ATP-binding cassette domain-containing protein [Acidimicrobiales bacterium]|nr:ATP-binding cassette domain-containing protein [Acidimicrobiales bacterium]
MTERDDPAIVRLRGVGKRYAARGRWVLRDVDLDARPATLDYVMGSNGSGKSTLLKIVAGLTRPSAGSVVRGAPVGYAPERQPARVRMTALAYVITMGRVRRLTAPVAEAEAHHLLDTLRVRPDPGTAFHELSKGNRQKTLVAQALMGTPRLIVLDEPLTALDAEAAWALAAILVDARAAGSAIVVSGQAPQSAIEADRTLEVADGAVHVVARPSSAAPAAPGGRVRIGLVGVGDAIAPGLLDQLGPVRERAIAEDGSRAVVVVDRAWSDHVIRRALDAGFSIEHVERLP